MVVTDLNSIAAEETKKHLDDIGIHFFFSYSSNNY